MTGPRGPYRALAPGMYQDADGNVVFNAADILRHLGLDDTPDNRRRVCQDLLEVFKDQPDALFFGRDPGGPAWREEHP